MDNSRTLHQFFEIQASLHPQDIAALSPTESITYEGLNQKANQLAHYLISQGVQADTLVALFFERSIEFLIALLGVLKAGGAYIPLDVSHPNDRLTLILEGAGNPLLITSKSYKKKWITYPGTVLAGTEQKHISAQPIYNPDRTITAEQLAYVIYTSGSTGKPKGVLIQHKAIINYTLWFSKQYNDTAPIDFSANPAFDMAITLYLVPLALGLKIVICKDSVKKDPALYLAYLNTHAIRFIKLTPSYFKILLHEAKRQNYRLPHLKKIMLGGENLAKAECQAWLKVFPHHRLYNEYGPTETTVAVSAFAIDKSNIAGLEDTIPIGHLALNTYAYLLDEQGQPVAQGEVGELYLGGVCLAKGYLNNPELTQKYFISDALDKDARLYRTGDLCRFSADTGFSCIGRIDHQLKIRGFRVEPDEIAGYLNKHPKLLEAVVLAYDQSPQEKNLAAYYILKNPKKSLHHNELKTYLRQYVPDYMIPAAFIRIDVFPLNGNGKLDRTALPIPRQSSSQHYVPARTNLQKLLAQLWSEELAINPIGIKDDFFELGGHSLSAARIISKINQILQKEISLHSFYQHSTIASLISVIKKAPTVDKKNQALVKTINNRRGLFPLGDFQLLLWMSHTFEPQATKLNIFTRKRIKASLDSTLLQAALRSLLYKHELLSYHPSSLRPGQYLIRHKACDLFEEHLEHLSSAQREVRLEQSLKELMNTHPWPKNEPQIRVRLFHLDNGISELQLCIPHIISDDLSPDILLQDLSHFYSLGEETNIHLQQDKAYRSYLFQEQWHLNNYLNRDIEFWDNYLKDTPLHAFPPEQVVKDMQAYHYDYSTYLQLSESSLNVLSTFCAEQHISLLDGFCAIIALALKNTQAEHADFSVCINRVKSTRDNRDYDNTIGCFLRIEPIKLRVPKETDLLVLAQDIHQAVMTTHPYQGCPNLIKIASIGSFRQEKRVIKHSLIKAFFWLYSMIFCSPLYYKILSKTSRLHGDKGNLFLININMQSNFLISPETQAKEHLFGFKEEKAPDYHYDLLKINNFFDVSFLRMADSKIPYLVLSANLNPAYREGIGQEMIRIIHEEIPLLCEALC